MHAMNTCSHIILGYLVLVKHILDKDRGWDSPVSIIRYIAILCRYEDFISILPVFSSQSFECCSDRSFSLLASIVDCCVKKIDSTTHKQQLDRIINIKVCLIIRGPNICAQSNRSQF